MVDKTDYIVFYYVKEGVVHKHVVQFSEIKHTPPNETNDIIIKKDTLLEYAHQFCKVHEIPTQVLLLDQSCNKKRRGYSSRACLADVKGLDRPGIILGGKRKKTRKRISKKNIKIKLIYKL